MKILVKLLLFLLIVSVSASQVLFDESGNYSKRFKLGSFTNSDGKTVNITNIKKTGSLNLLKNNISAQHRIDGYIFIRSDRKIFKSEDLRKWLLIDYDFSTFSTGITELSSSPIIPTNLVRDVLNLFGLNDEPYEIYSLYGVKVQEGRVSPQIDIGNLSPGFYIIKTISTTRKFIKY